jgi:alkylhydroperoxidase family enzyme
MRFGPDEAEGELADVYRQIAHSRSLGNILRVQSLHPAGLRDHSAQYRTLMFGRSPLTRSERESIAVWVSRANDCHY